MQLQMKVQHWSPPPLKNVLFFLLFECLNFTVKSMCKVSHKKAIFTFTSSIWSQSWSNIQFIQVCCGISKPLVYIHWDWTLQWRREHQLNFWNKIYLYRPIYRHSNFMRSICYFKDFNKIIELWDWTTPILACKSNIRNTNSNK